MAIHESNFRTKHKNALWDIINDPGLDGANDPSPLPAGDFEWLPLVGQNAEWTGKVRHTSSGSAFSFTWKGSFAPDKSFAVDYAPHLVHKAVIGAVDSWPDVLAHFGVWLRALAEEATPDYWEQERVRTVLAQTFASDFDSDFTSPEIERIGESFKQATREIHERGLLSIEDLSSLSEVLTKQHDAAKTTQRIQWQTIAATAVITRLMERGVDAVTIDAVVSTIGHALIWLNAHLGASLHSAVLLLRSGT